MGLGAVSSAAAGWLGRTLAGPERRLLSGPGALVINVLALVVGRAQPGRRRARRHADRDRARRADGGPQRRRRGGARGFRRARRARAGAGRPRDRGRGRPGLAGAPRAPRARRRAARAGAGGRGRRSRGGDAARGAAPAAAHARARRGAAHRRPSQRAQGRAAAGRLRLHGADVVGPLHAAGLGPDLPAAARGCASLRPRLADHELAHPREEARGLRRAGAGGDRAPGPGDHDVRVRAGAGRQGQPHHQPLGRSGARAACALDPHHRADPGQVGGGHRGAQPGSRGRLHPRPARIEELPRERVEAHVGPRQGHLRQSGGGGSLRHAARARGGRDGHGQERVPELDALLDPVPRHARRGEAPARRSEAARALDLRGHPAPDRRRGDEPEARGRGAAGHRPEDGGALPADGGARRAQHRAVQSPRGRGAGQRREDVPPAPEARRERGPRGPVSEDPVHRGGDRRARRPDGGVGARRRGVAPAPRADGARVRASTWCSRRSARASTCSRA